MALMETNRPFAFVCDPGLHSDLEIVASLDGCSRADVVRRALLQFMRRRKQEAFDEHPRARRMMARSRPEQQIQRAIVLHLQWRARRGVWWTHVPNGGWRWKVEGAILKGIGVVAGAPDLLIVAAGRAYFLELKAKHGRMSAAQRECHEALCAAGACVAVAFGIDEALEVLTK
jgi:hypothetical protein